MTRHYVSSLADSAGWTGGLIYLQNLIETIMALPDRRIDPVLLVAPGVPDEQLIGFGTIDVIRTPLVSRSLPMRAIRKAAEHGLGRDIALEIALHRHRIDLLSHSGYLGPRASIPTLVWLPDFQHVRMPEFFGADEIAARDRGYSKAARWATAILLSSADAQSDLAAFAPGAETKSHVLHFVAGMVRNDTPYDADFLASQYAIQEPFFYIPNQFWKHKNHRLVIDALALLAAEGRAPMVISTGKTEDRRNPAHFAELMAHAEAVGAAPYFKVLGLIPYEHLSVLFRESISLINPSYFEGWSTTIEEAKSLGKRVILSDIPVHREQAPPRGIYVDPDDPRGMADAMLAMMATQSSHEDEAARQAAAAALPGRRRAFGETYQRIVEAVLTP